MEPEWNVMLKHLIGAGVLTIVAFVVRFAFRFQIPSFHD